LFKEQNISEESHLLEWLNQHEGVKYRIEQEANEFAGRLLVPREALLNHFDEMKRALTKMHGTTHWQNDIHIREKACELIAPKFGVHRQSIATRFDREGIWQSP
jgi:Zn-dependent peptidase ImmA (M78 family)